jgi:hypothetical protein
VRNIGGCWIGGRVGRIIGCGANLRHLEQHKDPQGKN